MASRVLTGQPVLDHGLGERLLDRNRDLHAQVQGLLAAQLLDPGPGSGLEYRQFLVTVSRAHMLHDDAPAPSLLSDLDRHRTRTRADRPDIGHDPHNTGPQDRLSAPKQPRSNTKPVARPTHPTEPRKTASSQAQRWAQCYRAHGPARMRDHSSRPHYQPRRVCCRRQRRVVGLRITHQWGPARIASHLRHQHLSVSTVGKILQRYGCPPLTWIDKATGARLRAQPTPVRYEHDIPGWLVHVEIKKLGRIPDGGGHRMVGCAQGVRNRG